MNQKYALEHQMLVVECMEDPDETLKRKTLELLFRMTNASNVVFVVDKLVSHLRATTDTQFRAGLTEKITQLAERCEHPDRRRSRSEMEDARSVSAAEPGRPTARVHPPPFRSSAGTRRTTRGSFKR